MVSMIAFLTNSLLASVALAVPTSQPDTHLSIPRTNGRSHLIDRAEALASAPVRTEEGSYYISSYIAGAIYSIGNSSTLSTVTGTFIVPILSGADGVTLIGVNMDNFNCNTSGTLSAGVASWIIDGAVSYSAVVEWLPGPLSFLDMAVKAGDEITTTIRTISANANAVQIIIENRTRGQTQMQDLSSDKNTLCMHDAGWTLQPYALALRADTKAVPVVDFGQVEFTNAAAYSPDGTKYIAADAYPFEMVYWQNKTVLASASVLADTVTIQYV